MKSNIQTRTATFTTAYATMVENSQDSLVVMAPAASNVYLCIGVALGAATDALAILIPAGTGVVLEPAPQGPVHIKMTTGGPVSYWYT